MKSKICWAKVGPVLALFLGLPVHAEISQEQALTLALKYSEGLPINESTTQASTQVNQNLDPVVTPQYPVINAYMFRLTKNGQVIPEQFLVRQCALTVFVDPITARIVPKAYWKPMEWLPNSGGLYDETDKSWSCFRHDYGGSDYGGGT
jgi:hypothetical protein